MSNEDLKHVFTREQLADKMADFNKWLSDTSMSHSIDIPTNIQARMFIDQKLKPIPLSELIAPLVDALEDIANPLKKIQENAEKEGAQVNGAMALQLCKDGNWLQDKAKEALKQYKG